MKNTKRILEVKIIREVDSDPDTSYYGEYANRANSEFSIDRAFDEFQGDIENGRNMLDRIAGRLQDEYDQLTDNDDVTYELPENDWLFSLNTALETVHELCKTAPFDDDVYWNNREYRYFNPSFNYVDKNGKLSDGLTPEEVRKYVRQDFERMESYNRGHWCYVGVYATAEVTVLTYQKNEGPGQSGGKYYEGTTQTIRSGGLWGIESDSDRSHFEEVEAEQLSELRGTLKMLGFSARAISAAFKDVKREDA